MKPAVPNDMLWKAINKLVAEGKVTVERLPNGQVIVKLVEAEK
jgi:hypothetical protein